MITEAEAMKRLCKLMGAVNEALNDYAEPADRFCPGEGRYAGKLDYRNSATAIEFIEATVKPAIEALRKVRARERERARDQWEAAEPRKVEP